MRLAARFFFWLAVTLAVASFVEVASAANAVRSDLRPVRSAAKRVSFDETYERFPSPFGVVQQLRRIAPFASADNGCLQTDGTAAAVLGGIDPMQGQALESEPGALFYQYYQSCVRSLVRSSFDVNGGRGTSSAERILGAPLWGRFSSAAVLPCQRAAQGKEISSSERRRCDIIGSRWDALTATQWRDIDPELRATVLRRMVAYLVGPESVVRAHRYFGERNVFARDLPDFDHFIAFLDDRILATTQSSPAQGNRPEPLSGTQAYAELAILLRLGPALRN